MKFCKYCGMQIENNDNFCTKCGRMQSVEDTMQKQNIEDKNEETIILKVNDADYLKGTLNIVKGKIILTDKRLIFNVYSKTKRNLLTSVGGIILEAAARNIMEGEFEFDIKYTEIKTMSKKKKGLILSIESNDDKKYDFWVDIIDCDKLTNTISQYINKN